MTPSPEKRVFLLRHAKSSWDDPDWADYDRPLAPRGKRASKTMAEYLTKEGIEPDVVLCSSAVRARQTLERIGLTDTQIVIEDELYGASASGLLERLRRLPEETGSVMLIGHNPAMQDLALSLARDGSAVEGKYPTAALAELAFEGSWSGLRPGAAELVSFVTPKALAKN